MTAAAAWRLDAKCNEIIDRLNSAAMRVPIDENLLNQIAFQANHLRGAPLTHRSILGMIETLRGNPEGVVLQLEAARPFAAQNLPAFYANFAISLAEVGAIDEARTHIEEGLKQVGGHAEFLYSASAVLASVGLTTSAAKVRSRLLEVEPGASTADFIRIDKALSERGLHERQIAEYFYTARSLLREHGSRRSSFVLSYCHAEDPFCPVCIAEIRVPFSADIAVDLEDAWTDLLESNEKFSELRQSIVFKFTPEGGEEQDGSPRSVAAR